MSRTTITVTTTIIKIKTNNPNQLVTFHPFGRTDSSDDYHTATWLDFNMFQSGHRKYDQDTLPGSFKEDNYKFVHRDWDLKPTKPTKIQSSVTYCCHRRRRGRARLAAMAARR